MTNDNQSAPVDAVVPCPACDATGEMFATGIIYAEGHSGPYCRMMPCPDCNGKRVIPAAMLEWMERGKEIRHWRRSSGLTLRDAAQRAGLMPSEVSRLECGRVDNANWRELLKVE